MQEDSVERLFNEMKKIATISMALDELEMSGGIHPDTAKELRSFNINPDDVEVEGYDDAFK